MAARSDPPLKTLLKLVAVGVLGYLAYDYIYVRGVLRVESEPFIATEMIEKIRETILDEYADVGCLKTLENPHYQPKYDKYSIRLTIEDECRDEARRLTSEIADLVHDMVDTEVSVFAYDEAGNLVAKHVQ